jgi:hypothetical protein
MATVEELIERYLSELPLAEAKEYKARVNIYQRKDAPPEQRPGFVYFLRGVADIVKIGQTQSVPARCSQIDYSVPFSVKFFACFSTPDMDKSEEEALRHWHPRKIKGEWFRIAEDELRAFVEDRYPNAIWSIDEYKRKPRG